MKTHSKQHENYEQLDEKTSIVLLLTSVLILIAFITSAGIVLIH